MQAGLPPVALAGEASPTSPTIAPLAESPSAAAFGSDPTFDIAEPSLAEEAITRPWDVKDSPRSLNATRTARAIPPHSAPHARFVDPVPRHADGDEANSVHNVVDANGQRQSSPVPASSLVAPASPARPAPRSGNGNLMGDEAEYRERDGFTYSVRTTTIANENRTARSATPRAARAPRPLEGLKPAQTGDDGKTRSAAAPRPLTTSSNLRRTAPTRWFRPNPLRDSGIAQKTLRSEPYVQQASAQSPAGEAHRAEGVTLAQQPPAENLETVPSIADDQPLPFDLNAAEKEAAAPTQPDAKAPVEEPAGQPLEDDLSLDDLPFGDTEKKTPAETTRPSVDTQPSVDSAFPDFSEKKAPAEEMPAKENSAAPKSDEELPFPFDAPTDEKIPAEAPPMKEAPLETAPSEDLPFGDTSAEALPDDTPVEQPTVTEANATGLKSILAVTTSIAPPSGELPADRSQGASEGIAVAYCPGQASRGWAISEYNWKPTGMFHQPLYFEEVNLERYGYSHGIAQPAISYGQFLVNVIAMPYKVMAEPSREEVYTLGHYRPGSYAPYRIHYPPANISGGVFEAGLAVGLVFLIP
jgi:hypothetical protein